MFHVKMASQRNIVFDIKVNIVDNLFVKMNKMSYKGKQDRQWSC